MLRLMLDSHPALAIPGESHFIPALWRARRGYLSPDVQVDRITADILATAHFRQWGIPDDAVWEQVRAVRGPTLSSVISAVFMSYAAIHGKQRWGDKTPIYVRYLPLIARLFPEARFVHIIRDGRNVALSYLSVPWGPRSLVEAASKWRLDVQAGRSDGKRLGSDRYLEVRYEDLTLDPEAALRQVCDFAGLSFDSNMLTFHQHVHEQGSALIQSRPENTKYHMSVGLPPTRGLRDWRDGMSTPQLRAFEGVAGGLLESLGYERALSGRSVFDRVLGGLQFELFQARVAGSRAKGPVVRKLARRPPVATFQRTKGQIGGRQRA